MGGWVYEITVILIGSPSPVRDLSHEGDVFLTKHIKVADGRDQNIVLLCLL